MEEVSSQQLQMVIADFLELGHVENIVAMFRQDPSCLALTGALLQDERFKVRMGVAVLFEDLVSLVPASILDGAVPSLLGLTEHAAPYVRGDAAHILATIGTPAALSALARFRQDPDPQVAGVVAEVLGDGS
jgi:hypothetical protein